DEDTGEQMSDQQLRDEVMTMVLAGHETTANALSFSLYLLSKNPDVARRLSEEVATVLQGRTPTLADLPKLALTKRVLEESMRLFPPAWAFERQAIEDDHIHGFKIPKGAVVGVCAYVLHRDAAHWDNPEGFDPDRFLVDQKDRAKYTYLPFGGGARVCIGNAFAMMEAQIVLVKIIQVWRAELLPLTKLELDPVITLRPRGGLQMRIRREKPALSAPRGSDQIAIERGESAGCPHGVNRGSS
ncbi:MAG: cytochrome P450, partial [Polyangiaceae bacterium]